MSKEYRKPLHVLVGCERSGIVRDFFSYYGHCAVSCDYFPSETKGMHLQGDVRTLLHLPWDLAIFFPPCDHLAASGALHFPEKIADGRQEFAIRFFKTLAECNIPRVAVENPVGIMSTVYRKPDQYIQPWQFGHGETKKTCLWLKNLPKLQPTWVVPGRHPRVAEMSPSKDRGYLRSKTYPGIAEAMALQWGGDCRNSAVCVD